MVLQLASVYLLLYAAPFVCKLTGHEACANWSRDTSRSRSLKSIRPSTTEWQHGCKHLHPHTGSEVAYI